MSDDRAGDARMEPKHVILAQLVRQAFDRDDRMAMRLFGSNAEERHPWQAIRSNRDWPARNRGRAVKKWGEARG